MGDQLTDLLRERFTGHEMDVPPGAWEHVNGQLTANAGGESLRESLQDKFQGHEMEVDPSAWANISGQLGHGVAAGSSFSAGWIAAGVVVVAFTAIALFWNSDGPKEKVVLSQNAPVEIAQTSAPASIPAETLALATGSASLQNEQPEPPAVLRTAAPTTRQIEQRQVTPEPVPEPRSNTVVLPEQALASATAPALDQKSAATQPKAPAPVQADPAPENGPETVPTTNKPDAPVNEELTTTARTSEDPATEQPEEDPFHTLAANDIYIPNVFSPQGDGVNDKLKIVASGYEKVDVRVFAVKGSTLVFQSNDLSNMWDGRLPNGNIAEEGYYKCVVQLTGPDGRLRVMPQVVRLFR